MAMWIQDDFWEAAQAMPQKQRAPFLYAVMVYGFTGEEPKGSPAWLPTFLVIKQRIELSNQKSAKGKAMADARWAKSRARASAETAAQASSQHMQQHDASTCTSICTDDATACDTRNAESEREILEGDTPLNPPYAWQCLAELNEALGTSYTSMPPKCSQTLERFEGTYTLAEVRQMIEYKRDEWQKTRFKNYLTPNTLFSLDHFEQYMNQSRSSAAERSEYEQYD